MQRYFANKKENKIILGDGDVHHLLHVMRNKKGDEIEAVADNKLYCCLINSTNPLDIEISYEIPVDSELHNEVALFFALAKGDKIDFVIQKATELGVHKIVLIKTERCVVKLTQDDFIRKLDRYNKIAKEASEQSHRLVVPEIVGVIDIKNITVVEDSSVDRGGCIVETDFGAIDARISSQLGELETKILGISPIKSVSKSEVQNPDL